MLWPSRKVILVNVLNIVIAIVYRANVVIKQRITNAKSLKKINSSITGDNPS
jgi:hypothetical protein